MIVTLTFKRPDVTDQVYGDITDESEHEMVKAAIEKWVSYNEYITVQIDTKDNTCTVIPT